MNIRLLRFSHFLFLRLALTLIRKCGVLGMFTSFTPNRQQGSEKRPFEDVHPLKAAAIYIYIYT